VTSELRDAALEPVLGARRDELLERIARLGRVVVAYSGGVDSTLLAAAAHEVLGAECVAATAVSPSLAERELAAAAALARRRGWNHVLVRTSELQREEYARNAPDRCYWCKTELFEALGPLARRRAARIAVGTNFDDLGDYRPGLRAARESDVSAPLADSGLTKADVRRLSEVLGLATHDKPASPCLASRFAYGVRVTEEALRRVDRAEEHVRSLGFEVMRVRDHGDLARVEVSSSEIERAARLHEVIARNLGALGYRFVTLDLVGFRSGSLNEVLPTPTLRAKTEPR
jgi:uncharacterized protein